MTPEEFKRKLTAILSADVKGYSRLMGEDEEWTVRTLKVYKDLMGSLFQQHRGRVVDATGDNLMAEFASVVDAVECAIEIQKKLKNKNSALPDDRKMEFRIGVNLGDVIEDEDRLYGDGVNIAARIEGLAEPGGICISGTVYDQVERKLSVEHEYLGEQEVKNIVRPVRVYRVLMESSAVARSFSEVVSKEKLVFPLPDKPSIAVLPFTNMSGEKELDYFSDGLAEGIINGLSKCEHIFVITRKSTFTYKGTTVPSARHIP